MASHHSFQQEIPAVSFNGQHGDTSSCFNSPYININNHQNYIYPGLNFNHSTQTGNNTTGDYYTHHQQQQPFYTASHEITTNNLSSPSLSTPTLEQVSSTAYYPSLATPLPAYSTNTPDYYYIGATSSAASWPQPELPVDGAQIARSQPFAAFSSYASYFGSNHYACSSSQAPTTNNTSSTEPSQAQSNPSKAITDRPPTLSLNSASPKLTAFATSACPETDSQRYIASLCQPTTSYQVVVASNVQPEQADRAKVSSNSSAQSTRTAATTNYPQGAHRQRGVSSLSGGRRDLDGKRSSGQLASAAVMARRKNATRETTATLKDWLDEHGQNPYPTKGEKIMLSILTKMSLNQVSTWFANARRRMKKENRVSWIGRSVDHSLQQSGQPTEGGSAVGGTASIRYFIHRHQHQRHLHQSAGAGSMLALADSAHVFPAAPAPQTEIAHSCEQQCGTRSVSSVRSLLESGQQRKSASEGACRAVGGQQGYDNKEGETNLSKGEFTPPFVSASSLTNGASSTLKRPSEFPAPATTCETVHFQEPLQLPPERTSRAGSNLSPSSSSPSSELVAGVSSS